VVPRGVRATDKQVSDIFHRSMSKPLISWPFERSIEVIHSNPNHSASCLFIRILKPFWFPFRS
jgi:hypothetical protein